MSQAKSGVAAAAAALAGAYRTQPLPPLRETYPWLDLESAYDVQLAQVAAWRAQGREVAGHKVGLTSAVMQRAFGVSQPDFGHLTRDMLWPENEAIRARLLQPRAEPEVALVLRSLLRGPGVTAADAARAVDFVLPALEIIDSRIEGWKIGLFDTVADNASSAGVVLGSRPAALGGLDLRLLGVNLWRNGELVGTGAAGAALGSPLLALAWLANTLGPRGVALEAGHVVLPGSCTAAAPVGPGDVVTASFAGLGSVTARFGREEEEGA